MIRILSLVLFFCFSATAHASEKLLVLGDSLSAGYQMPIEESWPSLLPDALSEHGQDVTVINASISGDTTGNGLARLPQLLTQHSPDMVLIELG
ncbi:GDSL-type esterase/lipase family protein, partial [Vibrio parahaemolyticus]|nr:GDSL-type esterase/lipase family protein [Vibrio parahaemolyticus]